MTGRTIVTEWFRVPAVWPLLAAQLAENDGPVTVWSGACGTGQEAYSAAILLAERNLDGEVYATDIDLPNLETARRGEYPSNAIALQVREGRLTADQVAQHFTQMPDGRTMRVRDEIRARVEFGTLKLGSDPAPECHAALLRNVWRHLRRPFHRWALADVHSALIGRGPLILGGADLVALNSQGQPVPTAPAGLSRYFTESPEHGLIWHPN
ncbi:CheR family methyltransferase [Streptomyces sp. NPDC048445]|uniref:CheR family methyltransferase n=1 Tax=Streptomyces sp. NPDC048445 TaxID=3365553 RepID=UPI0037176C55